MQVTVYPNNELSVTGIPWGTAPRRSDRDRNSRRKWKKPESFRLDIGSKASQTSGRKGSRRYALSNNGRHKILKYAGLFRAGRKHRQVFVTGTLPGSTISAMAAFSEGSGRFIKILQTYVLREMRKDSSGVKYLWVWELQKRGALHVHAIFEWESKKVARRFIAKWHRIWAKSLQAFAGTCPVDIFARAQGGTWAGRIDKWQTDAETVKKSAGAYLAKYVGKKKDGREEYYPSRWYGASKSLRMSYAEWLCENVFRFEGALPPGLSRDCVVDYLKGKVKEFVVGPMKNVADRANSAAIAFFGYVKAGVRVDQVGQVVYKTLGDIGMEDGFKVMEGTRKGKAMSYINRVIADLSIRSSRHFYNRFLENLPSKTRNRFLQRKCLGRAEMIDIQMAMNYVIFVFYGASDSMPPWVSPCRARLKWLIETYEWRNYGQVVQRRVR